MTALSGPERPPARGKARKLVLFLHGLGANGNDLIGLAEAWAGLLPHAHFASPDAPEPYDMAPTGRQWFSLADREPAHMYEGASRAAETLDRYIDSRLAALGLGDRDLAFVGFSQGTMLSLHAAYRRRAPAAGVLGFSGSLVGGERLGAEITVRPPAFLIHGDADELVPPAATLQACALLGASEVPAQWHISRGTGHGIAPDGIEFGGGFLRDVLG